MNENHLHQIFENYIKKFEEINNTEHQEYYKWQIAKIFRPMMDDALKSEDAEFIRKLKQIRKKTENFIDSYTQPFGGLIRFADNPDDTYYYCFKDEGCHIIYHRFLPEDYTDFDF